MKYLIEKKTIKFNSKNYSFFLWVQPQKCINVPNIEHQIIQTNDYTVKCELQINVLFCKLHIRDLHGPRRPGTSNSGRALSYNKLKPSFRAASGLKENISCPGLSWFLNCTLWPENNSPFNNGRFFSRTARIGHGPAGRKCYLLNRDGLAPKICRSLVYIKLMLCFLVIQ